MTVLRLVIERTEALPALCALLLCCAAVTFSQSDPERDSSVLLKPLIVDSMNGVQISGENISGTVRRQKSPWLAVGLSAILPGSGQIYNEDYWKTPIIWGLSGYWIYEWVKLNDQYKDYAAQYQQSITPVQPSGNNQFLRARDFYRDARDKFAWYMGALYMVNLVDAYVGAHLYDFDVGPELGPDGSVSPKFVATLHLRF